MRGKVVKTYPFLFDSRTVSPQDELLGGTGEVGETGDGEVFMIEVGVFAQ